MVAMKGGSASCSFFELCMVLFNQNVRVNVCRLQLLSLLTALTRKVVPLVNCIRVDEVGLLLTSIFVSLEVDCFSIALFLFFSTNNNDNRYGRAHLGLVLQLYLIFEYIIPYGITIEEWQCRKQPPLSPEGRKARGGFPTVS